MGGFTSVPVALAGRGRGAAVFLHESNTIPGRANRWLAPWVNECFAGFPEAVGRLRNSRVTVTGTPVRSGFAPQDPGPARKSLGFNAADPVLVIMGGSQGAEGVNRLAVTALQPLLLSHSSLQVFHVTGPRDLAWVKSAAAPFGSRVRVVAFHGAMQVPLAAATAVVSRSGASSLAEFAAMRIPAVLIPFPAATDNHQRVNAEAMVKAGAARLLDQQDCLPNDLVRAVSDLLVDGPVRRGFIDGMAALDAPGAAGRIAARILAAVEARSTGAPRSKALQSQTGTLPAQRAKGGLA
jgi:UDP-N-acetylglucosamine--N-acetylmuramyl-(pentapeptide) pyrophosphoryl-undecaprenol N-acetylglucosamine transferase